MKPKPFAALLRSAIDASGKTVAQIAELSGMTRAGIYHLLNGTRTDPPWSTVKALAGALGISVEKLCG